MVRLLVLSAAMWALPAGEYAPDIPAGSVKYTPEKWTQSAAKLNDTPALRWSLIADLPNADWHQSGGMKGVKGVTSDKYASGVVREWVGMAHVPNGLLDSTGRPAEQQEYFLRREFADGTRFDDVLSYAGRVFEHRVAEKRDGKWDRKVVYADRDARPPGYTGLKVTCGSCHDQAGATSDKSGSGGYGKGIVQGGDGVFSYPLAWDLIPKSFVTGRSQ